MKKILDELFSLQDKEYREFNGKLIPTVSKENVIGIRIPVLRKYEKEIRNTEKAREFLKSLPHKYTEEYNLHALLLENIKSYNDTITALNDFLPFVDNWATCDIMSIKIFKKHLDILPEQLDLWLNSSHTYTIRFAIKMYMTYYLDDNFKIEYMTKISKLRSDEYYVNMMIAWYFATALAKQYDSAIKFLEEKKLSGWVHNKTIQKAIESYRITDEQKTYLRTLKCKRTDEA
ncbi:MAG: DNA alkylation repair protein [Clostridia bacterium]|nr:DNA alkylation repair protein [Clostridia bacterium]